MFLQPVDQPWAAHACLRDRLSATYHRHENGTHWRKFVVERCWHNMIFCTTWKSGLTPNSSHKHIKFLGQCCLCISFDLWFHQYITALLVRYNKLSAEALNGLLFVSPIVQMIFLYVQQILFIYVTVQACGLLANVENYRAIVKHSLFANYRFENFPDTSIAALWNIWDE